MSDEDGIRRTLARYTRLFDAKAWDELATIHLAPSDYLPHERRVVRVTAGLTTPVAARDAATAS